MEKTPYETLCTLLFTKRTRIRLYRHLEKLLKHGIQMNVALDTLYNRASNDGKNQWAPAAVILDKWRRDLKNGKKFGNCITGWVPYQEQMIIEAGDIAGDLPTAFQNATYLTINTGKMKSAITTSMVYPTILFYVLLGMMYYFNKQIIPIFAQILNPSLWTGQAQTVYHLTESINNWSIPLSLGFIGLITLYISTVGLWTGPVRKYFDKIPPWSMYRIFQGTSFLLSLASLLKANVATKDALRKMNENANPYLSERIESTLLHYNEGKNIGDSLHKAGYDFPEKDIIDDMRILSGLPKFEETIEIVAREWMEESIVTVQNQSKVMNQVFLVFIAICIGYLIFGMYDIQTQIKNAAQR